MLLPVVSEATRAWFSRDAAHHHVSQLLVKRGATSHHKFRHLARSTLSPTQAANCTALDNQSEDVSCACVSFPMLGLVVFPCLQDQGSLNLSTCPVCLVSRDISHARKVFLYSPGQARGCKFGQSPSVQFGLNTGWCASLTHSPIDERQDSRIGHSKGTTAWMPRSARKPTCARSQAFSVKINTSRSFKNIEECLRIFRTFDLSLTRDNTEVVATTVDMGTEDACCSLKCLPELDKCWKTALHMPRWFRYLGTRALRDTLDTALMRGTTQAGPHICTVTRSGLHTPTQPTLVSTDRGGHPPAQGPRDRQRTSRGECVQMRCVVRSREVGGNVVYVSLEVLLQPFSFN